VKKTLIEGGLLNGVDRVLFLRSWRSRSSPVSRCDAVLSTFIALHMFGFTFLTMMALSLCIGLLIDDAIVVAREHRSVKWAGPRAIDRRRRTARTKSGSR